MKTPTVFISYSHDSDEHTDRVLALADWLRAPAPVDVIPARQEAVSDLRDRIDLREEVAVVGEDVSPDLDTVIYTLAGVEGPHGWGRAGDTFALNDELARFGFLEVADVHHLDVDQVG